MVGLVSLGLVRGRKKHQPGVCPQCLALKRWNLSLQLLYTGIFAYWRTHLPITNLNVKSKLKVTKILLSISWCRSFIVLCETDLLSYERQSLGYCDCYEHVWCCPKEELSGLQFAKRSRTGQCPLWEKNPFYPGLRIQAPAILSQLKKKQAPASPLVLQTASCPPLLFLTSQTVRSSDSKRKQLVLLHNHLPPNQLFIWNKRLANIL